MPPTKCSWRYWTQWSTIYRRFCPYIMSVISKLAIARLQSLGTLGYSHHISLCHMNFQNFRSLYYLQPLAKTTLQGDCICRAGKKERRRCGVYTHD